MQVADKCRDRTSPRALRLEARQERLGIVANPAQVDIPVLPPREVWTRWPKLRSARRREALRDPSPERPLTRDPVLSGQKLAAFMSELRSGPRRLDGRVAGSLPDMARSGPAMGLRRMRGLAGLSPAYALPALLVALILVAGVLAWVFLGAG